MGLKKLWCLVSLVAAPLVFTGSAAGATFGQLGGRLEKAKETHFFRWFHLQETQRQQSGSQTVISFQPSGEKFRRVVTLLVTTDSRDQIQALELVLARTFVDHPRDGIFARDLAKSFLQAVASNGASREITDLINEIQYPMFHGAAVIGQTPPAAIKLPPTPTPGYQVYLGRETASTLDLANLRLQLENRRVGETPSLVMAIRPR
jgi:hypothetical protein